MIFYKQKNVYSSHFFYKIHNAEFLKKSTQTKQHISTIRLTSLVHLNRAHVNKKKTT